MPENMIFQCEICGRSWRTPKLDKIPIGSIWCPRCGSEKVQIRTHLEKDTKKESKK